MKILVFDNYDSFTYNLVHMVEKIVGIRPDVYQNDSISLEKVNNYDKIILSPGPGLPSEAGLLLPLIKKYAASKAFWEFALATRQLPKHLAAGYIISQPFTMA